MLDRNAGMKDIVRRFRMLSILELNGFTKKQMNNLMNALVKNFQVHTSVFKDDVTNCLDEVRNLYENFAKTIMHLYRNLQCKMFARFLKK